MGCEENFITIKLIWHSYLIFSLDNCVYKTPTETGLMRIQLMMLVDVIYRGKSCIVVGAMVVLSTTNGDVWQAARAWLYVTVADKPTNHHLKKLIRIDQIGRQPNNIAHTDCLNMLPATEKRD